MSLRKNIFFLVICALFMISHFSPCLAQRDTKRDMLKKINPRSEKKDELKEKTSLSVASSLLTKDALESEINADEYKVGPGDQLLISLWGQVNESFPAVVSPEGFVLVPSVKEIDVRNLTLNETKDRIKKEMKTIYSSMDISVSLMSLRSFRVQVTGLAEMPGSFVVSPIDRVSDVVAQAGGITDSLHASLRNIQVRRKDGTVLKADLIRKIHTGDAKADPILHDGDVIFIPPKYSTIDIYGAVAIPGKYEFTHDETIHDIIELAGGLKFGADSAGIELVRFKDDTSRAYIFEKIDLRKVTARLSDKSLNLIIQPNDRLFARSIPKFQEKKNAFIRGEVRLPGTYSIVEGTTKISDIIRAAGGFMPDAAISNIVVYRDIRYEGRDSEFERLQLTQIMEMNDLEKSYFKAKSRQYYPTVQTDFEQLFDGESINPKLDIFLKDGDVIDIARKKKTVRIIGGVVSPGIIDWVKDVDYTYYVNKCKGYTTRADKSEIRVIRPGTESWIQVSRKTEINDGDILFIPEKEPIDGWKVFRETVAMVGQLASITATIILIYYTVNK